MESFHENFQNEIQYLQSDNTTETYTVKSSISTTTMETSDSMNQSFGEISLLKTPEIYSASDKRKSLQRPQTLNKSLFRNIIKNQQKFKTWFSQDSPSSKQFDEQRQSQSLQQISSPSEINDYTKKYKQLEKLGEGATSKVYKVQSLETGVQKAAKIIKADTEEIKNNVQQEYKILKLLNNNNIIKPDELIYLEDQQNFIIIQELFEGKSFYDYLSQSKSPYNFDLAEIKKIVKQLLQTVKFIHQNNIIHRDVTVMNVLYCSETQQIKLIDFGIAREFIQNSENYLVSPFCNKLFAAPECKAYEDITDKIDVFGIGLILMSLLENKLVLSSKLRKIIQSPQYQDSCQSLYQLAANLVQQEASKRFTVQEALNYLEKL